MRRRAVLGLLAATGVSGTAAGSWMPARPVTPSPAPPLEVAGLVGAPTRGVLALAPADASGSYVPGSNVLRRPDGSFLLGPAGGPGDGPALPVAADLAGVGRRPDVAAAVLEDRAWLTAGNVPGRTPTERAMASRALLDLRMLTRPDGAVVAAERRYYDYVWPRDAAFVAAAYAATGRAGDAYAALAWVAGEQRADGTWPARSLPEGGPVQDGRGSQLDATGWFAWAVWFCAVLRTDRGSPAARAQLAALWPTVVRAADAAAGALGDDGLPGAAPDWWETDAAVTVGTSGTLRAGLRGATDLARALGDADAQDRWGRAATGLDEAIAATFAATGYRRTAGGGRGADAGVASMAPPFAPPDVGVSAAVADTARRLRTPSGGLRPGEDFPKDPAIGWTTATGLVLLADAASGRVPATGRGLAVMARSRTSLGALPEKIDRYGGPSMLAPLGWSGAMVLLALVARDRGLPVPPVPGRRARTVPGRA